MDGSFLQGATAVWLQPESTPLFGKLLAVESAFDSLIINDVTR
jgi:hypothetical protein